MSASQEEIISLEDREHLLLRPDTLCGSTAPTAHDSHVFVALPAAPEPTAEEAADAAQEEEEGDIGAKVPRKRAVLVSLDQQYRVEWRELTFSPAVRNLYQEILTNALDRQFRDNTVKKIEVWIDCAEAGGAGWLRVRNDGYGVSVVYDEEQGAWKPTMAFSHFRSGSNFDDTAGPRWTAGRNGYGCKATNVFSAAFCVDTCDPRVGKRFQQSFSDNMSVVGDPSVTVHRGKRGYTDVSFRLDYARMGSPDGSMTADTRLALEACTIDATACLSSKVCMYLNGTRLGVKHLRNYTAAFAAESGTPAYDSVKQNGMTVWEVSAVRAASDSKEEGIGFVNSLECSVGTHMSLAITRITGALVEHLRTKHRRNAEFSVSSTSVRRRLFVAVRLMVDSPEFSSQTKEKHTTPQSRFGFKWSPPPSFTKALVESGVADDLYQEVLERESAAMRRVTGGGTSRRTVVVADKYDAATNVRKRGSRCSLLVTEGDSARALAVAGLAVVGRENFGIFALKGKPLNVRNAKTDAIAKNKEVTNLMKIIGLTYGATYTTLDDLYYKKLVIFSDQDPDGAHIGGLVLNIIHALFPSVLQLDPAFVQRFPTPLVRATPKSGVPGGVRVFYALPQFNEWAATADVSRYHTKYFKGLGTSTSALAREYFSTYADQLVDVVWSSSSDEIMCQMFQSDSAAARRTLLRDHYNPASYVDYSAPEVTYEAFIRDEVLHYSSYSNERNIPSVVDGMKPGQRKALFTLLDKNITSDVKVAQVAAQIAAHTAYHHGEQSMVETVVGMAQDHVGVSNVNLFQPEGQFGSRLDPPSVHSAARYIFTSLDPITRAIFPVDDDAVLEYRSDEGVQIEPTTYVPVIPMALANGAFGIGTGWSTSAPMYDPQALVEVCRAWIDDGEEGARELCAPDVMMPWYDGFRGSVELITDTADEFPEYTTRGCFRVDGDMVHITELPVGVWTHSFVEGIESKLMGGGGSSSSSSSSSSSAKDGSRSRTRKADNGHGGLVKFIDKNWTDSTVDMVLHCDAQKLREVGDGLVSVLGMENRIKAKNMHFYSATGRLEHYRKVVEVVLEHAQVRLAMYDKRRMHQINALEQKLVVLTNKRRFVQGVLDGTLVVHRLTDEEVDTMLASAGYARIPDFGYLLNMTYRSTTAARVEKLDAELEATVAALDVLRQKTARDLWGADLDALEHELAAFRARKRQRYASSGTVSKKRKAGAKKATGSKRARGATHGRAELCKPSAK